MCRSTFARMGVSPLCPKPAVSHGPLCPRLNVSKIRCVHDPICPRPAVSTRGYIAHLVLVYQFSSIQSYIRAPGKAHITRSKCPHTKSARALVTYAKSAPGKFSVGTLSS